jgi:hypothetical protein
MKNKKNRPFFALLIILGLNVLCVFLGLSEFGDYFSYGNVIVFSWLSVSLIALPLILFFPLCYFTLFLFKSEEYATQVMGQYVGYLKILFVIIITVGIAFSLFYKNDLTGRGYIACKGIPSGWMPGTATTYVLDPALCSR